MLLLIPAGYGVYLLQQQGSVLMAGATTGGDIFDNPLLFLLPALAALALTLIVLRLLPLLMALVAWIAARTDSVGFLLATRCLALDPASIRRRWCCSCSRWAYLWCLHRFCSNRHEIHDRFFLCIPHGLGDARHFHP